MATALDLLRQLGVDIDNPKLFNSPAFVQAERSNPQLLETYLDYVRTKNYDQSYLDRARGIITKTSKFLHHELKLDGRLGACIDTSCVLMAFLAEMGIWSCAIKGAMRIDFNDGIENPTYLAPIVGPQNPAKAGHVWVFAPPFVVVDIAGGLQPYSRGELHDVDFPLLIEDLEPGSFGIEDLFDIELVLSGQVPTLEQFRNMEPDLFERIERYGVGTFHVSTWSLTYLPTGAAAPEALPLASMENLVLRGQNPQVLFDKLQSEM